MRTIVLIAIVVFIVVVPILAGRFISEGRR